MSVTKLKLKIAKAAQENHKKDHEAIERAKQRRVKAQREKKK